MVKRKGVSARVRFEIFKRDGFRCAYCSATPMDSVLHVDHILAVANGGTNAHENLITACDRCNLGKSAVPLEENRFTVGDPKRAKEHAEQLRQYMEAQQEVIAVKKAAEQQLINMWCDALKTDTHHVNLVSILSKAITEFGMERVCDFVSIVAGARGMWAWKKNAFETDMKYFCGILRKRREGTWK